MRILGCACMLVALVCLQRLEPVSGQLTPLCALEGYDITTLSLGNYWDVTFDKSQCLRPEGLPESEIVGCHVFFSICHALPHEVCPINNTLSISVCQVLTLTNSTTLYYDQGLYSTEREYFANDKNESYDGFFAAWNGTTVDTVRCKRTIDTLLLFQCNPDVQWDPRVPTSARLKETFLLGCEYFITVEYSGACYTPPTLSPKVCTLPPYNIDMLSMGFSYWSAMVDPRLCIGSSTAQSCLMTFAFCHPLPPNVTTGASPCTREATAVCQIATEQPGPQSFSLGMFSNSTHFFPKEEQGVGGFLVEFVNGSNSTVCPKGSRTKMVFNCDPAAKWTTSDISQYTKVVNIVTLKECEFEINFNYSGACVPVGPIIGGRNISPVGWILMGIFFFVVLGYLLVGSLYQYFAVGARGLEILPNSGFWSNFGKLVLEGCTFSLNVITCHSFNKDGHTHLKPETQYDKI